MNRTILLNVIYNRWRDTSGKKASPISPARFSKKKEEEREKKEGRSSSK